MINTREERENLIELSAKALNKIKATIDKDIDDTDPEKVKIAVQGKMEAINSCKSILSTIDELNELNNESNAEEDQSKSSIFDGLDKRAKK